MKEKNQKWNTSLYDEKHKYVSNYGKDLIELLDPYKNELILDLGCGTGDLTNEISISGAYVTGIDESQDMINKAREKYPNLDFIAMDANNLNFSNRFDKIFSNAVLHWINTPKKVLQSVYNSLNEGGKFVAEFGGAGNCNTITSSIIDAMKFYGYIFDENSFPWFFPTIGQYASMMETIGFKVDYARHYDRPTELEGKDGLRNLLNMFFLNMFKEIPDDDKPIILDKTVDIAKNKLLVNDVWLADYKRIQVISKKICI